MENLAFCLDEEEGTSFVVVCQKCFSMEKIVTNKSEEKKKLKLMHGEENTNSKELIEYFKPKLQFFCIITLWQGGTTKTLKIALNISQLTIWCQ